MAEEKKNMPTVDDQYQRLINARNYHYDNLNKWLMTFYVIIGALFVAFYTLYSKGATMEVEMIVAIVGYLVSLSAFLSGKGYCYWEHLWMDKIHHFEKHVLGYEDDMQVYAYLVDPKKHDKPCHPFKGANVSTTKMALFMTATITVAWGVIILTVRFPQLCPAISIAISVVVSYLLMLGGTKMFPSIEKKK
jgi:hypothetical protein